MNIRKYVPKDRREFTEMCTEFYNSPAVLHSVPQANIEKTADLLKKGTPYADCYIMEENGEIAGYCLTANTYSNEAGGACIWIEEIFVKENFRGRGLGGCMIDFLKKQGDYARLRLEAEAGNKDAVRLYERKGFRPLEYIQFHIDV